MISLVSHSPDETAALGEQWGRAAQPGWVIGLSGDLGAGKTQLVKGLARGLGFPERIHSPTFALVHEYTSGRLPLYHLDLYRLDTPPQIIGAGLEDYFYQTQGVTVIEWAERWFSLAPSAIRHSPSAPGASLLAPPSSPGARQVRLEIVNEQTRRITYEDFSA